MKTKPISWFALWKRLGKQPLYVTRGRYVTVRIDNKMYECRLEYYHNGSQFCLVPIRELKEQKNDNNGTN